MKASHRSNLQAINAELNALNWQPPIAETFKSKRVKPAPGPKANGYQKLFEAALGHKYSVRSEVRFHPTRRWRFDLTIDGGLVLAHRTTGEIVERTNLLAVEIDGGGFVSGRHSRGSGIQNDCEKYAAAMILGWRILRVTPQHIKDGRAFTWIEALLK